MDVNFINPFIAATDHVFQSMTGMTPERKDLKVKDSLTLNGDVSGIMSVNGDANGVIIICMNFDLANTIYCKVTGEETDSVKEEDAADAVGEMLNIISGQAKTQLEGTKYHFQLTTPEIIMGKGHRVKHPKGLPCINIDYEIGGQPLTILVSLKTKQ